MARRKSSILLSGIRLVDDESFGVHSLTSFASPIPRIYWSGFFELEVSVRVELVEAKEKALRRFDKLSVNGSSKFVPNQDKGGHRGRLRVGELGVGVPVLFFSVLMPMQSACGIHIAQWRFKTIACGIVSRLSALAFLRGRLPQLPWQQSHVFVKCFQRQLQSHAGPFHLAAGVDGARHPALAGAFVVAFTVAFAAKQVQAQEFAVDDGVFAQCGQFAVGGKLGASVKGASGG